MWTGNCGDVGGATRAGIDFAFNLDLWLRTAQPRTEIGRS